VSLSAEARRSPADVKGRASVAEIRTEGPYSQVRLRLTDGREIFFNERSRLLVGSSGRPLAVGCEVLLTGERRLPDAVWFDDSIVFIGHNWWRGNLPPVVVTPSQDGRRKPKPTR
jgi:hypothetical protein